MRCHVGTKIDKKTPAMGWTGQWTQKRLKMTSKNK